MTTFAVIPVKQLENAKGRLAGLLSPEQRAALVQAMFEDVLKAAADCPSIDATLVVTADRRVSRIAEKYGARLSGTPPDGLIPAVDWAAKELVSWDVQRLIFLPADIPLVTAAELEIVLAANPSDRRMTIVPASDLGGSNCVVCCPPDCIDFGFGEDSYRRHLRIAEAADVPTQVFHLPGIGLDVDTPEDFAELRTKIEHSPSTQTGLFLQGCHLIDKDASRQVN